MSRALHYRLFGFTDRVCSLVHTAERRHKDQLEEIVHTRSSLISVDTPTSPQTAFPFLLSQSCDFDVHEPIESSSVDTEGERDGEDTDVIVDEEMLQRKMEIQQKLSNATR